MQPPYAGEMDLARRLLGLAVLVLVAAGLVVGLMPVDARGYDCGTPLKSDTAEWEAHDAVADVLNGAGGDRPADKTATCRDRTSARRTASIAFLVCAGVVMVGSSVALRERQPAES